MCGPLCVYSLCSYSVSFLPHFHSQVISERETEAAIVRASSFPLALLIVGVGDGPFGKMEHYDDHLECKTHFHIFCSSL